MARLEQDRFGSNHVGSTMHESAEARIVHCL
jgi:hypothetical protein